MIHVGAAVIKKDNKVLICQRAGGGSCAFLWEFPGGKLEPNESIEECVIRECREELGIEITVTGLLAETKYKYPDREISFTFYYSEIISGVIEPKVHKEVKWLNPSDLGDFEFCPADVEIALKIMKADGEK
jgi:ADP-ribose pyrophosphatase